ncbi:uncharacterized protein LOC132303372 isoform X2 [Cornus florida]|uniref:uncharacterized protein LOC132303372 isoform X2 n=1 Tax=Cornus florida TaxID=4283 RepID=UPI00289F4662|nr:uncharacterized protein LOC132303372 isoform X2 [Cornus florida]XP_059656592.1 uncharacterized protein LOC132303372 isoform X2 [Cornus florida]
MDTITFHKLKKMELRDLSTLTSFNCKTSAEFYTSGLAQLFNDKVRFPALEELEIINLYRLTAIWDNQLFLSQETEDSFQQLRLIKVYKCERLVNVIPPNVLPLLQNLESVEIDSCDSIVSGIEVVAIEEGGDEIIVFPHLKIVRVVNLPNLISFCCSEGSKEEASDKILVFPQLNKIRLSRLPKFGSFYCFINEKESKLKGNIPQRQALFNHKVKFPCVEDLVIEGMNQYRCLKLFNVASTESLTSFQNLKVLHVKRCDSLQAVFKVEGSRGAEETVASDKAMGKEVENNLVFPQLNEVVFEDLPSVTSFCGRNCISELPSVIKITVECCPKLEMFPCRYLKITEPLWNLNIVELNTVDAPFQPLPNEMVEFPILDTLIVSDESHVHHYCKVIRSLEVRNCWNLVNLSTLLQRFENIQKLTLKSCYALECIWITDPQGLLVFHNLTSLTVEKCMRLRYLFSLSIARGLTQLRDLNIVDCAVMEEIFKNEEQDAMDEIVFSQLHYLRVKKCIGLKYLFPLSITRSLTQLRDLRIEDCDAMEEIIKNAGGGGGGRGEDATDEIVFSQLGYLKLSYLPNLTCFCQTNNVFKFPSLTSFQMKECPSDIQIWILNHTIYKINDRLDATSCKGPFGVCSVL